MSCRSKLLCLSLIHVLLSASLADAAPRIIEGLPAGASGNGESAASDDVQTRNAPSVWEMPQLQASLLALRAATAALFKQGDFDEAEKRCRQSIRLVPHDPAGHYLLACTLARQGKVFEALDSLGEAVELGFNKTEALRRDPNLQALRGKEDFAELVAASRTAQPPPSPWRHRVSPARVAGGKVTVSDSNTAWDAKNGVFVSLFQTLTPGRGGEAVRGQLAEKINAWYARGTAAGNRGDFYDNHDGGHSRLNSNLFPQITHIQFDHEIRKRNWHSGLQTRFFYNAVVLGNSSTALVSGPFWRSQPRLAYVSARQAAILYGQYTKNHLYFYPEHHDHDERHGDLYPANTPYVVISQGSSGSDRPFMNAFAYSLAALRPEVKSFLAKNGALMPTLQMIFRRTNRPVAAGEDYLTGRAHPTVFDRQNLQSEMMVQMAHEMTRDNLPPLVKLKVVKEDEPVVGRDYFDIGSRQKLFTTPCAIARVHRMAKYDYRMIVSAEDSRDLNGRDLSYHWKVLRGDSELIEINPLNEDGSIVDLKVKFHPRRPVAAGSELVSNRVDIGCFVHNGKYFSAPAFVTFHTSAKERREYSADLDVVSIDYSGDGYIDPMIFLHKNWKDTYIYADDGELVGWVRQRGDKKEHFTRDGGLIIRRDEHGRALVAAKVEYVAHRASDKQAPVLKQKPGDELWHYGYNSIADRAGHIVKRVKVPE